MLSSTWRAPLASLALRTSCTYRTARFAEYSTSVCRKQHDPLRILFCGADEFSIYSLRALHDLQQRRSDKIKSIDVLCRPDKRHGRGLKQTKEVPIKRFALDLGLDLHQVDSLQGWSPPHTLDLVVAVSFGLLVPTKILTAAKYGGLNVHPSLLPEFRGAAPIQHTLLQGRTQTGVSLQTMHPTRFDHGLILDQTSIDVPRDGTVQGLIEILGPLGAKMLSNGVEHGIFAPPMHETAKSTTTTELSYAPKITSEDRHIDWKKWTAEEILRHDRVLGSLWDETTYSYCMYGTVDAASSKRVILGGPWIIDTDQSAKNVHHWTVDHPGRPMASSLPRHVQDGVDGVHERPPQIGFRTADGFVVVPTNISIEGRKKNAGHLSLLAGLKKLSPA